MPPNVRYGNGIRVTLDDGQIISLDSTSADDVSVCSHAHADHLFRARPETLVCSPLTAALAGVRRQSGTPPTPDTHPLIELLPAGHVAGSTAALIEDGDTGRSYCYTGDVCTRDRFYLEGFEPPSADVLIVESTYGKPECVLPDHDALAAEILDWLADTMDRPVVLFGYALGRAQKLQMLVEQSPRDRLFVTEDIQRINDVIAAHRDVTFDARAVSEDVDLGPSDALVVPGRSGQGSVVDDVVERAESITAGFSGWAVDSSYRYRRDCDVAFPLSDHCDYEELLDLVAAVDPEVVYTHHGFADAFAGHVTRELGIHAQSLKRNQTTLSEF